jgi:uncharacterized protein (TIGR03435 family)
MYRGHIQLAVAKMSVAKPAGAADDSFATHRILAWKEFSIGPATANKSRFAADGIHAEGVPFLRVISRAYGVPEFRIVGPDWMQNQRYAITATVTDPQDFQPLLRQELAKRSQFAMHWDSREMSVYTLKTIEGVTHKLAQPTGTAPMTSSTGGRISKITLPNGTTGQFVTALSEVLSRPVFDETGLPGRFDFSLSWSPNDTTVSAAVREQLGLQLVESKRPIDMLVVDRVEKAVLP